LRAMQTRLMHESCSLMFPAAQSHLGQMEGDFSFVKEGATWRVANDFQKTYLLTMARTRVEDKLAASKARRNSLGSSVESSAPAPEAKAE
jgi:hypothetical protein